MQKANGEEDKDSILTVMDANQFMDTMSKALSHDFQTFLAEHGPELIDAALGSRIAAIEKRSALLEKSLNTVGGTLLRWYDHYDDRQDDIEQQNVELKKSMSEALETFSLIKSHLLEGSDENLLGDKKPKLEPMEKSAGSEPTGKILNPAGEKPGSEKRGEKIIRLCKAADALQEKTHKPVDGYTDAWVTIQGGAALPDSALTRLEKGVAEAELLAASLVKE